MSNQGTSEANRVKNKVQSRIASLRKEADNAEQRIKQLRNTEAEVKREGAKNMLSGARGMLTGAYNSKKKLNEISREESELQRTVDEATRNADILEKQLFTLDFWAGKALSDEKADIDEAVMQAHQIERSMY